MPRLVDVAEISPGIDRSAVLDPREIVSFVPMASVSEVTGAVTSEEARPLSEVLKGFTAFQDRDVLVAKITPCFENGKIAHARIQKRLGFGSTEFHVIRPNADKLDDRYLFHFLRQPKIREAGERRMTGSGGQRRVPRAFLAELDVPLPPLPEQRRIAAILDKADALRAMRREAIAKLDQLLQSVFLNMFGDPVTNPKGWPVVSLGDLAAWKSGGTPSRSNPAYFTGDIPWYASGELDGIFISDSAERITKQAVAGSAAKIMEPGTLMIGMYDTSAFKLGISTEVGTCNQAIAFGLINSVKAETLYVYHALDIGKEHFKRLQRGVRQKNLNLSMVRDTRVPCPPVELQKKFSSWFAMYWREVSKQRQVEERLTRLSSSLQTTAFSGGL
ncbi:MAG: restriction endonuclease subunit S [Gammaproteobacteria bacterium]|nr:restriction endonuclease subunit S [Gammaproteobacteria bacterium]